MVAPCNIFFFFFSCDRSRFRPRYFYRLFIRQFANRGTLWRRVPLYIRIHCMTILLLLYFRVAAMCDSWFFFFSAIVCADGCKTYNISPWVLCACSDFVYCGFSQRAHHQRRDYRETGEISSDGRVCVPHIPLPVCVYLGRTPPCLTRIIIIIIYCLVIMIIIKKNILYYYQMMLNIFMYLHEYSMVIGLHKFFINNRYYEIRNTYLVFLDFEWNNEFIVLYFLLLLLWFMFFVCV